MPVQPSLRVNPENLNHHLWNNNGTWFVHYVVHPTPYTKERIRHSLRTKSVEEARARRDALLESLTAEAQGAPVATATPVVEEAARKASKAAKAAKLHTQPSLTKEFLPEGSASAPGTSPAGQTQG